MNDAPELRRVTTDESTTFHAERDWLSDDELSDTIVAAVASVTGTDPTELSPLTRWPTQTP
ncbi:hypothetical protein M0R89_20450 (plasmid) [Halorussus limi]|uniref:Halobacterial output domain-containing protein n=1 Tax=Halorussus limi TaxID=2938695 RepID=A0A8U0I1S6_9EURY|nr:HalOD1 output domain-containing protein [Halorussus limi]UPV76841.1 hypothetical protein M0R89_20450 [Halorussus limi]